MNQPHYQPSHPKSRRRLNLPDFHAQTADGRMAAEKAFQKGNLHYNNYLARSVKKDLEQAVRSFRQAVELEPAMAEAQVKLASALWDQGTISVHEALQRCELALQHQPRCAEAFLFLGYFLRRAGQLEQAQAAFRQAIANKGLLGAARARIALGSTQIQQAVREARSAAPLRVLKTMAGLGQVALGLCLLPGDRTAFAVAYSAFVTDVQVLGITCLGRSLKLFGLSGPASQWYQWASNRLPQEPIFLHLLGDLQMEKGKLDAAIYYYNRCGELDSENLLLHKKLGYAYSQCDDAANAAKSLEKLVKTDAEDFETLYKLAQIYTDSQEYIRALYYYKELLVENYDNPYLHSHIAFVMFKLEDYDGAIEEYQTAIKMGRDSVWTATVAQTLGTIHYQIKHNTDEAVELFQLATQLDPSNLDAWAMLGDIYTEQGHYEKAVQIYRRILQIEPDNADCHNYLGYLLWQLDKNDEAVDAYQRAIALNIENPIAFNNLGVIFLDEKCQLEKALEMFQQAFELKPDYTLACFNIGRTKEALGQTTEAAQTYSQALSLNEQNPELSREEILERLDQLFKV